MLYYVCHCNFDIFVHFIFIFAVSLFSENYYLLNLSQSLRDTYCTLYFDNFFSSPALIGKLFVDGIYGIDTVQPNRLSVVLLGSNIDGGDDCSSVQRREV